MATQRPDSGDSPLLIMLMIQNEKGVSPPMARLGLMKVFPLFFILFLHDKQQQQQVGTE
jgi:hypothetical protein